MSMSAHISRVLIHQPSLSEHPCICLFLFQLTTKQLLNAFVMFRLDMGNTPLSGVTQAQPGHFQRVQSCASGLVNGIKQAEHITCTYSTISLAARETAHCIMYNYNLRSCYKSTMP